MESSVSPLLFSSLSHLLTDRDFLSSNALSEKNLLQQVSSFLQEIEEELEKCMELFHTTEEAVPSQHLGKLRESITELEKVLHKAIAALYQGKEEVHQAEDRQQWEYPLARARILDRQASIFGVWIAMRLEKREFSRGWGKGNENEPSLLPRVFEVFERNFQQEVMK